MSRPRSVLALSILLLAMGGSGAAERMPPIPKEKMTVAQVHAVEQLLATPRGPNALSGPFVPLLRSPELMNRLQKTGEYLRFDNRIGRKLTEFVILLTARQWTQQFEFNAHAPLALKAGVRQELIAAIAEGRRPAAMDDDEALAYDYFSELRQNQSISDATYARAVSRLGEPGVIDMTALIGYYTTLAMVMNVTRAPLPDGAKPPLPSLPQN